MDWVFGVRMRRIEWRGKLLLRRLFIDGRLVGSRGKEWIGDGVVFGGGGLVIGIWWVNDGIFFVWEEEYGKCS